MAILLRRSVLRDSDEAVFVDVELDGSTLTLGTAADNSVQLAGLGVTSKHAEIRASDANVVAQLRSFGRAVTLVNGNRVQRQSLQVGDEIEIGSNLLTIIAAPAGFQLALQVQQGNLESGTNLEMSYRTDLQQTGLSKRSLAWLLVMLVAAVGIVMPLLLGSVESVQQAGVSAEAVWTSGPLHLAHQDATGGDCGACHTEPFVRVPDSACVQCHATTSAHAQPFEQHASTAAATVAASSAVDLAVPRCASCHVEHGEPPALVSPATDHCQGCHGVSALAQDHPDFSGYPNVGRTQILFDHQQHSGKHFGKTEREFECVQCHQPDANGRQMVAGSFENMCVDCHGAKESTRTNVLFHHGDQIMASDDLVLFTLPRLDLKTLADKALEPALGYWPPETKGGSRSGLSRLGLTAITELLLSAEPRIAGALGQLRSKKTKLASLRRASTEELAALAILVPEIKSLLAQLAEDPRGALAVRLEPLLKRPLQPKELVALGGGLTPALVQGTASQWFMNDPKMGSAKSVQAYLDLKSSAAVGPVVKRRTEDPPGVSGAQLGGWQAEKFSLRYSLSGHGDAFVHAWIALTTEILAVLPKTDTPDVLRDSATAVYDLLVDGDAKPGAAKGAGRCTKCHDLQQAPAQALLAQSSWQGSWRSRPAGRALFAHQPHLRGPSGDLQMDVETCNQCHQPTENKEYLQQAYAAKSAERSDLPPQTSPPANFKALTPGQCAQCHTPKTAASDACLECHAYHPHSRLEPQFPWVAAPQSDTFEAKLEPK